MQRCSGGLGANTMPPWVHRGRGCASSRRAAGALLWGLMLPPDSGAGQGALGVLTGKLARVVLDHLVDDGLVGPDPEHSFGEPTRRPALAICSCDSFRHLVFSPFHLLRAEAFLGIDAGGSLLRAAEIPAAAPSPDADHGSCADINDAALGVAGERAADGEGRPARSPPSPRPDFA